MQDHSTTNTPSTQLPCVHHWHLQSIGERVREDDVLRYYDIGQCQKCGQIRRWMMTHHKLVYRKGNSKEPTE